jgi:hypothetical protein
MIYPPEMIDTSQVIDLFITRLCHLHDRNTEM